MLTSYDTEYVLAGIGQVRHTGAALVRAADVRARHHALRHARTAGLLPAAHPVERALLVPGLFRTAGWFGPGGAALPGGARRRRLCRHRKIGRAWGRERVCRYV